MKSLRATISGLAAEGAAIGTPACGSTGPAAYRQIISCQTVAGDSPESCRRGTRPGKVVRFGFGMDTA